MDAQERSQKSARTRTFRRRWTVTVDNVKKRGLLIHDIRPAQRGPELAALSHMMRELSRLVEELEGV